LAVVLHADRERDAPEECEWPKLRGHVFHAVAFEQNATEDPRKMGERKLLPSTTRDYVYYTRRDKTIYGSGLNLD